MRTRLASVIVAALVISTFQAGPGEAAQARDDKPYVPRTQKVRPVPHQDANTSWARPKTPGTPRTLRARGALPEKWDALETAEASKSPKIETLAKTGSWKGKPLAKLTGTTKPGLEGRYHVGLADQATVKKLGAKGLVFRVTAEPGSDTTAKFTLDYQELIKLRGLDWVTRLRLATLPACALTTPHKPKCQVETPLDSANDPASKQVTAELTSIASDPAATSKAAPTATAAATLVSASPGPGGSQGTYLASNLQPSGSWSHGGASGAFNWNYPITTTQSANGQGPGVGLSYSSSSVDGMNSNANPQSSWVGTGFDYQPGYVERTFRNCKEATPTSTDQGLCWASDILTLHMPGGGTQALVVDSATGKIRPEGDNGEKVERLTGAANGSVNGEHWRITTTDGTRYTFGANILPGGTTANATKSAWNVPVYGGTSTDGCATKRCTRTWRWNLDMVQDTHNNVSAYYYTPETNYFVPSGTTTRVIYDRGGYLNRIDYGIDRNDTSIYSAANPPNRVTFAVQERCNPTGTITCTDAQFVTANAANWPDVPIDQKCASTGTCNIKWPTFWTRKRLATIATSYYSGTAYTTVDSYALAYNWSQSTSTPALNLVKITRTATAAGSSIAMAPVTLYYATLDSRVKGYKALPDMGYDRLTKIVTETGAQTDVVYNRMDEARYETAVPSCTAATVPAEQHVNAKACFPVNWVQPFQTTPTLDYFHKYAVVAINETDATSLTPGRHTEYTYTDPGWHFDDNEIVKPAQRTWSQWRGYRTVETRSGNTAHVSANGTNDQATRTKSTYYLGMHGDRLPGGATRQAKFTDSYGSLITDKDEFAGISAETRVLDGTTEISNSRITPDLLATTATRTRTGLPTLEANVVQTIKTIDTTFGTGSGSSDLVKTTTVDFEEASTAEPFIQRPTSVRVSATGGTGTSDGTCTTSTYADNTNAWIRSAPAQVSTYEDTCDAGAELVSRTRTYYDSNTALGGTNITAGDVTKTENAADQSGDTVRYTTQTATYDARGRVKTQTVYPDGAGSTATARTTSMAYTISTGGVLTGITTTLPTMAGVTGPVTTTQNLDPARGVPTSSSDIAGRTTSATIDALGRYTAVWNPGRTQGTNSASITYAYKLVPGEPLAVTTKTLVDTGNGATPAYDTSIGILDSRGVLTQTQTDTLTGGRAVTDSFVDSHGRVVATNDRWYTGGAPGTVVVTTADGNLDARTTNRYDGVGRPTTVQHWRGTETQPVNSSITIYGGDRTTVLPPTGGVASTTLVNGLGQTTELRRYTEPVTASTFNGADSNRTTYGYGPGGKLTTFTTAAGTNKSATWNYTYDLLGRQIQSNDPDSGTSTTTFDDTGAPISTTDAANRQVSTTYDAWGRPIDRYNGTTAGAPTASWKYDTLVKGELTSSSAYVLDETTAQTRTFTNTVTGYSATGLPTGTDLTLNVPGLLPKYSTRATFTTTGLPSSRTLAATRDTSINQGSYAEKVSFWYDKLGQQTGLAGTNTYLVDATYTPYGEASQYVLGGGDYTTAITYTRDPHHRWITNTKFTGQLAQPQVANVAATYDTVGNTTRLVDTQGAAGSPTQTTCYRYDTLQQLTDAWSPTDDCVSSPDSAQIGGVHPFRQNWTYDAAGSRETQTIYTLPGQAGDDAVTTYTNGTAGHAHALATATTSGATQPADIGVLTNLPGSMEATYTATGATDTITTPDGDTDFAYGLDGALKSITAPGEATTEYIRDADGSRLLRIDRQDDTTSTTLYLPGQQVTAKITSTGTTLTTVRHYALVNGQQIAVRKNATNPVFTLADPHGTTQLTYDPYTTPTAPPVSRRAFDPYGNELTTTESTPWIDDRTFLNKPANPITDLVDMGAREYNPATGRFTSVDPLIDPSSPTQANGYNYANNNPVGQSDPSGAYPVCGGNQCANATPNANGTWNIGAQPKHGSTTSGEAELEHIIAGISKTNEEARDALTPSKWDNFLSALGDIKLNGPVSCTVGGGCSMYRPTVRETTEFAGEVSGISPAARCSQTLVLNGDCVTTVLNLAFGLGMLAKALRLGRPVATAGATNAASGARLAEDLSAAQAANPLIDSLRATGDLPSNYVTKSQAAAAGWSPGKALDNYIPGGQLGGDVFKNPAAIGLPTAPGRTWYEADIGLSGSMSRAKQPGTRLLYSNDGMSYVTPNHYGRLYQVSGW